MTEVKLQERLRQAIDFLVDSDAHDVSSARLKAMLSLSLEEADEVLLGLSRLGVVAPGLLPSELAPHILYPIDLDALRRYGHSDLELAPKPRPRTRPSDLAQRGLGH